MKPLRNRLQEGRARLGLPWEIIERDYLLSWILAGISKTKSLNKSLVFKGGTALKKCYFGEYRFSEDLDFTAINNLSMGDTLETSINEACKKSSQMLNKYVPVKLICERYVERHPHPTGQEAFTIRAQFPWHRQPQVNIMIEITKEEKILMPIQQKLILHAYEEPMTATIQTYSLEEIIAEKLRAILQHTIKLKQRGWSRSRARDYYDIWRILNEYKKTMNLRNFSTLLKEKCAIKNVTFEKLEDFFEKNISKTSRV